MILRGTMVTLSQVLAKRQVENNGRFSIEWVEVQEFNRPVNVFMNFDNIVSVSDGHMETLKGEPYCFVQTKTQTHCFVLGTAEDFMNSVWTPTNKE